MPTYEYECQACKHNFDEFQSIMEAPLKKCPKCGRLKLQRKFGTGAAVLFKGSGFYQTDYRSESYKAAAKADQTSSTSAKDDKGALPGLRQGDGRAERRGMAGLSVLQRPLSDHRPGALAGREVPRQHGNRDGPPGRG
jgi:putative FmdB family regulatory protein